MKLPGYLPQEELEALVARYRAGQLDLRNEIVESHLRLVYVIATNFSACCPRKWQELVGEAYWQTIVAVERFQRLGKDNQITPYIARSVVLNLRKFLRQDRTIRLSSTTITRRLQDGTEDTLPATVLIPPEAFGQRSTKVWTKGVSQLEIKEVFDRATREVEEPEILDLHLQGYNTTEIGEAVGLSQSQISKKLAFIREKIAYHWRQ